MHVLLLLRRDAVRTVHMLTASSVPSTDVASTERWASALTYEAPFLYEKLLKNHVVESWAEADTLFREVKRYLVLTAADPTIAWTMYSLRIDEIWHQFILFTRQYIEYCSQNFGRYIQHAPSTAPAVELPQRRAPSTFAMFAGRYAELYGEHLPDPWYDERNVTIDRRIVNPRTGSLDLRDNDDMVELLTADDEPIFAVDRIARPALEFIGRTGTFFVRELPGDLLDEQKIALISTLVECKVVDLAA